MHQSGSKPRPVDWVAAVLALLAAGLVTSAVLAGSLILSRAYRLPMHLAFIGAFLLLALRPALLFAVDGRLRPVWRFFDGLLVFGLANGAGGGLAVLIARSQQSRLFDGIFRPTAMALSILGFSLLLWGVDRVRSSRLAAQGLPSGRTAVRDTLVGIVVAFVMITGCWLAIAIWGTLTYETKVTPAVLGIFAVQLLVLAMAAMLEEVAFRGYPFQRLVEAAGPVTAILVLSAFFGLAHANNPNANVFSVTNTALIGAVFCIAYLRTRALWFPFGLHWGWNAFLGMFYGLPVSGVDLTAGIKGQAEGPVWLTGGSYGIEAAPTATAAILLGLAFTLWWFPQRPPLAVEFELPASPPPEERSSLTLNLPPGGGIQQQ